MNNIHVELGESYESPIIKESNRDEWVEFGEDNNYFQWIIDRFVNSPTNNAIINNICKLIYGRGLDALNSSSKPSEYAQMVGLFHKDCIKQIISDYKMLGQFAIQVIYNKDRSLIVEVNHVPIQLLRAEKCNEEGEIMGYYYSDDWTDTKKYVPIRYDAYGKSKETTEIMVVRNYSVGMKYYSYVDYQGSLPYTLLEQEISDYLINEVQNSFSGTKIVNFNNGVPDDDQRNRITRDVISKVTGTSGLKTIVAFNNEEKNKTTIDDVSLNDAPAHYDYLSEECMRKILLGHNVTSPLLFGIATTTGFGSNADELKNSFTLYYNMVIRPYQECILDALNSILGYNGISLDLYFKTLKPLEFTNDEGEVEKDEDSESRLSSQKKEFDLDLKKYGHKPDNRWVLIDEFDVDLETEDAIDLELSQAQEKANSDRPKKRLNAIQRLKNTMLVSTGSPKPDEVSIDDWIINEFYFLTRYVYEGDITSDSRKFCRAMRSADLLYRKEDIAQMSKDSVNPGWGPEGVDNYDILKWKGGGNCHHLWRRRTYIGLDVDGQPLDPNSDEAERISTYKARKYGYNIRNPRETAVRPIDLPNKGFLPK